MTATIQSTRRPGMPEVLAPAGDLEKLKTSVAYGADAVYMSGKTFGLRTFSGNFTREEMIEGIEYAHAHGVKAYVTMNIMAHEADMALVDDEIRFVASANADAVIVSDAGIFRRVRNVAPDLEIHISTQASVTNAEGCLFWYEQGARRVVLARECSLEQIAAIRAKIPADMTIECFIHGAMCVSYSGRCLLSNYYTGRSSNKGACAQPCRWGYYVDDGQEGLRATNYAVEEKRLEDKLPIEEDERGTYIFNSKDICMIEHVPDLIAAGVDSFKIEGRIKGAYYAAAATKAYREAVDYFYSLVDEFDGDMAKAASAYKVKDEWLTILDKVVHRDYATGFFYDAPGSNAQIVTDKSYNKPAFVVALVEGFDSEKGLYQLYQKNKVFCGDIVNALMPTGYTEPFKILEMYDEEMNPIDSTPHSKMRYYARFDTTTSLPVMTYISRDGDKDEGIRKQ